MSGDENFAFVEAVGELDVSADAMACQVMAPPKRQLCSLSWQKFFTRVASVVEWATKGYALGREGRLLYTDAVVSRALRQRRWHRE